MNREIALLRAIAMCEEAFLRCEQAGAGHASNHVQHGLDLAKADLMREQQQTTVSMPRP